MGIESYFINAILVQKTGIDAIASMLKEASFSVSPFIEESEGIPPHACVSDHALVVDRTVLLVCYGEDDISLQACYACYEKSLSVMSAVLTVLYNRGMLRYIYYGDSRFDPAEMTVEEIFSALRGMHQRGLRYFRQAFTEQEIEILPHSFYGYYRKHRRKLKKSSRQSNKNRR